MQELFAYRGEALPLDTSELLLDSYRVIPNEEIQESTLKLTTTATKHSG